MRAHMGQQYGPVAFESHLRHVQSVLRRFGYDRFSRRDRPVFIVAWLHDVLEDTSATPAAIGLEFGQGILRSVETLTLDPHLPRLSALLLSLARMNGDPDAVAAKLADRIANVEICRSADPACFREYLREWAFLREPFHALAHEPRARAMLAYLDALHGLAPVGNPRAAGRR